MKTEPPQLEDSAARWRRRIALPLITLLAAGGIWFWNDRQARLRDAEVEDFMKRVLRAASEEARPSPSADAGAAIIAELVHERLRAMTSDGTPPGMTLHRGDHTGNTGEHAGLATHHAIIVDDGAPRLAVRLVHPGDAAAITMIGIDVLPSNPDG